MTGGPWSYFKHRPIGIAAARLLKVGEGVAAGGSEQHSREPVLLLLVDDAGDAAEHRLQRPSARHTTLLIEKRPLEGKIATTTARIYRASVEHLRGLGSLWGYRGLPTTPTDFSPDLEASYSNSSSSGPEDLLEDAFEAGSASGVGGGFRRRCDRTCSGTRVEANITIRPILQGASLIRPQNSFNVPLSNSTATETFPQKSPPTLPPRSPAPAGPVPWRQWPSVQRSTPPGRCSAAPRSGIAVSGDFERLF